METQKVNQGALDQARGLFQKFNALTTPPNIYQVPDQQGTQSSMFPASIGSTDPDDQRYMLQSQLVQNGTVANIGTPIVGKEFFDYAKRKQDQAMLFDFTQWVMKQADLSKPESAAWWFEKFPWMKELRLGEIEREAEVQKRLAKISITGPQDQEDFMILFMKNQGLLKPADVPLYQLGNANNAAIQQGGFIKGVFNPLTPNFPVTMPGTQVPFSNPVNGALVSPPPFPNPTATLANSPNFSTSSLLFGAGQPLSQ